MRNHPQLNNSTESIRFRRHRDLRILIILSALMSFASISTDLYLPALPAIANELQARQC
ncbi:MULTISPECIES: hypothetical protein [Yersinia]|uniref:hypothetical protein n=1 Tax=Yersinia TaxID=629 RepID=UPI00211AD461|nr:MULTISPECIES: hypothetical protein [Yersinia]UYK11765.1 hypothetical protein N4226_07210 [Yersinia enterocolitica]